MPIERATKTPENSPESTDPREVAREVLDSLKGLPDGTYNMQIVDLDGNRNNIVITVKDGKRSITIEQGRKPKGTPKPEEKRQAPGTNPPTSKSTPKREPKGRTPSTKPTPPKSPSKSSGTKSEKAPEKRTIPELEKATTRAKTILDAMRKITAHSNQQWGYDGDKEGEYFTLNNELKDIRSGLRTNADKAAFVKFVERNGKFTNKKGQKVHVEHIVQDYKRSNGTRVHNQYFRPNAQY